MSVSFEGFGNNVATFKTEEEITTYTAVKMSASDTVEACSSEAFCGIAYCGKGGYTAVQLSGTVTMPYTGTAPEVGYTALAGNGESVIASESGREYLVVSVNETENTVTFIM